MFAQLACLDINIYEYLIIRIEDVKEICKNGAIQFLLPDSGPIHGN